MELFYQPGLPNDLFLSTTESNHCIRVLRKQKTDEIEITDGRGNLYKAAITNPNNKKCEFEINNISQISSALSYRHIAIAPTKNIDRIEWFVEKAVEIGVDEISFILCQHAERKIIKIDRIKKKAISAMKQSYKFKLPQINELVKFNEFIKNQKADNKVIAYVNFENNILFQSTLQNERSNIILIGPEGDFSQLELANALASGYKPVSLGNSRLRTETAGIAAVHIMNLFQ